MKEFLENIEDILEKDDGSVKVEDHFREYSEWDSLSILSMGAMINEEYDLTIPRSDFEKLSTIGELYDYIEKNK